MGISLRTIFGQSGGCPLSTQTGHKPWANSHRAGLLVSVLLTDSKQQAQSPCGPPVAGCAPAYLRPDHRVSR